MKKEISMNYIANNFENVFQCKENELYFALYNETPKYYNYGVYGWNCDIYTDYKNDIAIVRGRRNTKGKEIPKNIIKKYEEIAMKIKKDSTLKYYEKENKLHENVQNLFDELLAL